MMIRVPLALLTGAFLMAALCPDPVQGCCAVSPSGKPVVNADQTVIMIWDPATRTQHFIRQASFKADADNFGFLVPTPSQPELEESGNEAFGVLRKLTEPEKIKQRGSGGGGIGCGCSARPGANLAAVPGGVQVLEEKRVAGFNAVVLMTDSSADLVAWLKDNGYVFSPEVETWAKPYVEAGWKITALKVAKDRDDRESKNVAASALRLSFKTDRPLFPYREPDSRNSAQALNARSRLLRIYFVSDCRYQGELTPDTAWTGRTAWAGKVSAPDRKRVLEMLRLPETTGPAEWWLTEFEDDWPYQVAPADVYFSQAKTQKPVTRPPVIEYTAAWPTDVTACAILAVVVVPPLLRRVSPHRKK